MGVQVSLYTLWVSAQLGHTLVLFLGFWDIKLTFLKFSWWLCEFNFCVFKWTELFLHSKDSDICYAFETVIWKYSWQSKCTVAFMTSVTKRCMWLQQCEEGRRLEVKSKNNGLKSLGGHESLINALKILLSSWRNLLHYWWVLVRKNMWYDLLCFIKTLVVTNFSIHCNCQREKEWKQCDCIYSENSRFCKTVM